MANAAAVTGRARETVHENPWPQRLGRIGLASRGVVYCVVALLAVQIAVGDTNRSADAQGAFRSLASQPLGRALLALLAVGFIGYALWRFAAATLEREKLTTRLVDVGAGLIYVALLVTDVRLLLGSRTKSSDEETRTWTSRLLAHDWGPPLVIAAGAVVIVVGIGLAWWAMKRRFLEHIKDEEMGERARAVV